MLVVVIGATGFIGRYLLKELEISGHEVIAVSRNAPGATDILGQGTRIREWNGLNVSQLATILNIAEGIVNLAGENISSGRWTKKRKKLLTQSRVKVGKLLTEAVRMTDTKPKVLIQASAIGIYGPAPAGDVTEGSPGGEGFLAELTNQWEESVSELRLMNVRVVYARSGLILGSGGGVLQKLLKPYRFYLGGPIGTGKQWVSWIHLKDHVAAIRFMLENDNIDGPVNLVSPQPVRMDELSKSLARALAKPGWFRVPEILLKLVYGEMARETILSSQKIFPVRLLQSGFKFTFDNLDKTFEDLIKSNARS